MVEESLPVDNLTVIGTGDAVAQIDGAVLRLGLEITADTAAHALTESWPSAPRPY